MCINLQSLKQIIWIDMSLSIKGLNFSKKFQSRLDSNPVKQILKLK